MRYRFLLGCLLLSGFAGLAYELLWVRLLALSFGSTAASFSTVLAVFFGGLAVGSFVGGRIARRVARPVRAYALVELGTGVAALALYPVLLGLETTFGMFDPGPGTVGTLVRLVVGAAVLMLPTVLMGATLPFVTRAMVAHDDEIGRATALIYAFNTFGACLGAYVTTFWLLPYLGVLWSTVFAALLNFAVFGLASWLGRNEVAMTTKAATTAASADEPGEAKLKTVGTGLALVLGFAAVALQVVWVRIFASAMEGTVYGTGSVLIAVLVGIGVGSLVLAPFLKRSAYVGLGFVALQVAGLAFVLLQFKLLPWISYELGAIQLQRLSTLGLHLQMLIVVLAVLGPSVCSGASLPLIISIVERRASQSATTVGNIYAANTVGAIIGSLLVGFIVLPTAGSEAAVMLAVVSLGGAAAFGALFLIEVARPVRLALVPIGLLLASTYTGYDVQALASGPSRGSFADWQRTADTNQKDTLLFSEAESSNVRVIRSGGWRALTLNGLGQGGRAEAPPHHTPESLLLAAIPLSHAENKDRALLVGLGAGVTVDAMVKMGVNHIRVIELEPKVVEAVKVIFPQGSPLDSDRVEVVINDARHFLNVQRSRGGEPYDIIASMPAHPWVASPIFTREFFEIVKDNLSDRGVFCSWFGLLKMDSRATDSLLRAFASVFDNYVIYFLPGNQAYFLVGGRQPLEVSPKRYRAVFQHPAVREHRHLTEDLFLARSIVATSRSTSEPTLLPGPINTDDRPIVEMLSPTTTPTRATASVDLFSVGGVDPVMVPGPERQPFIEAVIESLLGTPNGQLPLMAIRPELASARTMFERGRSVLTEAQQAYFEVRFDIAKGIRGPRENASNLSDRIAKLPDDLRRRAEKARAWSLPRFTPVRARALAALSPDTDVLLHQLEESGPAVLQRVPAKPPSADQNGLGWWLWYLAHGEGFDAKTQRILTRLGPDLAATGNEPLLVQTASVARAAGATTLARTLETWVEAARRARVNYHRQQGLRAGRAKNFRAAARHLWAAFVATPLDPGLRMPLVQSLVEVGDAPRLRAFAETLRFQGLNDSQIRYWFDEARRRQAAGAAIESGVRPRGATPSASGPTGG